MEKNPKNKASISNPALNPFSALIGEWKTTGTHPYVPGTTLYGYCSFKWIEGGAFLMWQSAIDKEEFPTGIGVFGSDDSTGEYFMLYFDERKVSRKYEVSVHGNIIKWWRNAPGFSQRYSWTISENSNSIIGKGEMSKDGTKWEKDLEQIFTRVN